MFAAIVATVVDWLNWSSFTVWADWSVETKSGFIVIAVDVKAFITGASFTDSWAGVDFVFWVPSRWVIICFSFMFTVADSSWDWSFDKFILPAVIPYTVSTVISLTWLKNFTSMWGSGRVWDFTVTFSVVDTVHEVSKYLSSWASYWFIIRTGIHAMVKVVLAFSPCRVERVAGIFTSESTVPKSFIWAWTWSWCSWSTWLMFLMIWDVNINLWGWSWNWTWETNTSDDSFHTITRSAAIGFRFNFFTFGVFNSVDFSTETGVDFNAFITIRR